MQNIKNIEEFLYDALFDSEEVNSNFSQEFSDSILAKHNEEDFIFDWQSLEKASKLVFESNKNSEE
ncbi:30155_t:CDS:2 [Gigaspora margarita]|uniref:30155_t:CDS:1 n=1 Tax=Gigaspora margarita TaxID=4874 RepID=A0ABN7UNM7_GIGMA|nr:30155_t:CDS:2 [Gigaspora margarita]